MMHTNATYEADIGQSVIFLYSMFIFAFFGHSIAFYILMYRPSKEDVRNTFFYQMIKVLLITDITSFIFFLPQLFYAFEKKIFNIGSQHFCTYLGCVAVFSGNMSILIVFMTAMERVFIMKFTFQYALIMSNEFVSKCVIFTVIGSITIAILPCFAIGKYSEHWPDTWCYLDFHTTNRGDQIFYAAFAIVNLSLVLLVMVLNFIFIHHVLGLRRSRRRLTMAVPASSCDSEIRVVVLVLLVMAVLVLSYVPIMIRILLNVFQYTDISDTEGGTRDQHLDLWAIRAVTLNPVIDPWVYIISRVSWCKRDPKTRESSCFNNRCCNGIMWCMQYKDDDVKRKVSDNKFSLEETYEIVELQDETETKPYMKASDLPKAASFQDDASFDSFKSAEEDQQGTHKPVTIVSMSDENGEGKQFLSNFYAPHTSEEHTGSSSSKGTDDKNNTTAKLDTSHQHSHSSSSSSGKRKGFRFFRKSTFSPRKHSKKHSPPGSANDVDH